MLLKCYFIFDLPKYGISTLTAELQWGPGCPLAGTRVNLWFSTVFWQEPSTKCARRTAQPLNPFLAPSRCPEPCANLSTTVPYGRGFVLLPSDLWRAGRCRRDGSLAESLVLPPVPKRRGSSSDGGDWCYNPAKLWSCTLGKQRSSGRSQPGLQLFCTTKYVYSNLLYSDVYQKIMQHPSSAQYVFSKHWRTA